MSEPLVIVGNGMAAARFCEELVDRACGRYAIAVIGEEPRLAYNRVLLSSLLADEISAADIELKPARWWRDRGVTVLLRTAGDRDRSGDPAGCASPTARAFPIRSSSSPPARGRSASRSPGMDLRGVKVFRDFADVGRAAPRRQGRARCRHRRRSARTRGRLRSRQGRRQGHARPSHGPADGAPTRCAAPRRCWRATSRHAALPSCSTPRPRKVEGHRRVEGVRARGRPRDRRRSVVVAVGIRPNAELARTAGIDVNRGIVVDDGLQTSVAGIHAIGECAEHRGLCYGLVEPAYEQARVLAQRLAGADARYPGSVLATNLKVSGVNVFSAGDFLGAAGTEAIVLSRPGPRDLQEARHRERPPRRRGAVRRYRRRPLVSRSDPLRRVHRRASATTWCSVGAVVRASMAA